MSSRKELPAAAARQTILDWQVRLPQLARWVLFVRRGSAGSYDHENLATFSTIASMPSLQIQGAHAALAGQL